MRARATSSCAWRTGRDTDASVAALVGQSALITGASRGIGAAVARALAVEGARVVLLARTGESLAREAAAIGELALPLPCDLASPAQVQRALEIIAVQVGTPDILVSNAGAFALGAVGSMSPEEAEQMLQVNLAAPYRLLHALVPLMRARGHGHVVTIGSVADRHAYPENAAYAASKFGARAMHEVMREELRGSGVRATLVSPAPVDTTLWDAIQPETRPGFPSREQMLRPEAVAEAVRWAVTRPVDVNIDELRLSRA
jgi:NADP-dependent 3-hydroxy acid dehydrogenase YdfG